MSREDALLRAVLAEPDDDAPRLIFADWLEENGRAERAELIRLQCALAETPEDDPRRPRLAHRAEALIAAHWVEWGHELRGLAQAWGFERGFVTRAVCDSAVFVERARELFRLAPVHHLALRGARLVMDRLARCRELDRRLALDLAFNTIGNRGAHELGSCPYLTRLTALDLSFNNIYAAGARALLKLPHMPSLEGFSLVGNPIPDRERDALRRRFGKVLSV
jgi:uncharacterized protein (TIGR02996 family)